MVAFVPGTSVTAPAALTHASAFAAPPTVAEPVVSAVTFPVAWYSVEPAGHAVPFCATFSVTVVVLPLTHLIVPPVASCVAGIAFEALPVLPVHFESFTVLEMLPVRDEHLMLSVPAPDAGPANVATEAEPATVAIARNRTSFEWNIGCPLWLSIRPKPARPKSLTASGKHKRTAMVPRCTRDAHELASPSAERGPERRSNHSRLRTDPNI